MKFKYYYWGPFLFHSQITPDECRMLLKEGKKCRKKSNDHRSRLAGHLSEEYRLDDRAAISEWFKKYIQTYTEGYREWRGREYKPLNNLRSQDFWINYMKSNDFNPPHDHSGNLSFVIYPHVPKVINEENKNFRCSGAGPGGIAWFYGEGNQQYIDSVNVMPKTGDIFIFPASLKHWVFPFRSKVERISVSGNITFGDKGDNV
tara:strand:- start:238 stop:846 length:609 start_codon:yes stop_codon:yes gene_type:complete